jgi:hypothetical protein
MRPFRKYTARYGGALAFILLAFFGGVAINGSAKNTARVTANRATQALYQSQLAACHRGNSLIQETNRRIGTDLIMREAVISFLDASRRVRMASYRVTHQLADKEAASKYKNLIVDVKTTVKYRVVPLVDCRKEVSKP